jgi:hypothetical protein
LLKPLLQSSGLPIPQLVEINIDQWPALIGKKMQFSYTFLLKNLPVSTKISIFALDMFCQIMPT